MARRGERPSPALHGGLLGSRASRRPPRTRRAALEAAVSGGSATNLIARLEKELRDLWAPPTDPTAIPMSRVCTMNLEVVASSHELLERYTPVVDEVTSSIPSRVILA